MLFSSTTYQFTFLFIHLNADECVWHNENVADSVSLIAGWTATRWAVAIAWWAPTWWAVAIAWGAPTWWAVAIAWWAVAFTCIEIILRLSFFVLRIFFMYEIHAIEIRYIVIEIPQKMQTSIMWTSYVAVTIACWVFISLFFRFWFGLLTKTIRMKAFRYSKTRNIYAT